MQNRDTEIKRDRIRAFLREKDLDGVLLTRQDSFAWYTGGGQNHVAVATEGGAAALLATAEKDYLIANNIEAVRIMPEEGLADLGVEMVDFPWAAPAEVTMQRAQEIAGRVESDTGDIAGDLKRLRYSLTEYEVQRYREAGRDSAEALAETCRAIEPGQTEWQIAGMISDSLYQRALIPMVVLVAVDERISQYRHPIPTSKVMDKSAMVVICAKRGGLIVSTTRLVHFGPLSGELRKKHDAVMKVDATFIAGSQVGADVRGIFQTALNAYASTGFADEWTLHHQGGGTGYATRDFKGTHDSTETVLPMQAYAWNPSITGTKSEDTIIATPDGPEIISLIEDWPMVDISTDGHPSVKRADILVR